MKHTSTLFLCSLFLLSACGGGGGKSSPSASPFAPAPEAPLQPEVAVPPVDLDIDAEVQGSYLAVFKPVNSRTTGKITGAFTFARIKESDELVVDVRLTNAGADLIHSQHVRQGTRCPTLADDTNNDGYIDAQEGEAVYGKPFFPLDGDLSSQASHDGVFPVGNTYGNYFYFNYPDPIYSEPEVVIKATKFSDFVKDLRTPDENQEYFKLGEEEALEIEGKVVVVNGVAENEEFPLPYSVKSVNGFANFQTLPIVCGVIKKVKETPGTIDDGTYPPKPTEPAPTPAPVEPLPTPTPAPIPTVEPLPETLPAPAPVEPRVEEEPVPEETEPDVEITP